MTTKNDFLKLYQANITARYPWGTDAAKLDRFMNSVEETLNGTKTWNPAGAVFEDTCKALGVKPTLKAIQALPA